MRILITEDDFLYRRLLDSYLAPFGQCDIAINGVEALDAFKMAHQEGKPYDLICLDILIPELNGREVLAEIRRIEKEMGIGGLDGVKIIMLTVLDDFKDIKLAFREQCEAYLIKPISKRKFMGTLQRFGLLKT